MKPIGKANLSGAVRKSIQQAIKEEQYKPGERLPPIKDLSEELKVGISSVREGLKQLQTLGIVRIVQGKGVFVNDNTGLDHFLYNFQRVITLQQHDFINVMEARRIIECETARLSAQRVSDSDVAELTKLVRDMKKSTKDGEKYEKYDVAFHISIAKASRNPVLVTFLQSIQGLISNIVAEIVKLPGQPSGANVHHERILQAIKCHNSALAYKLMNGHLEEVEEVAKKYLYVAGLGRQPWMTHGKDHSPSVMEA